MILLQVSIAYPLFEGAEHLIIHREGAGCGAHQLSAHPPAILPFSPELGPDSQISLDPGHTIQFHRQTSCPLQVQDGKGLVICVPNHHIHYPTSTSSWEERDEC